MTRNHPLIGVPFFITLLGMAFCVWSALGNDVNICVTTGCALYLGFTVAGISLWWFGAVAFIILCICAILGQATLGRRLAALFLVFDTCLLLLMALTAPCVSCLVAGILFALSYFFFRRVTSTQPRQFPAQSSRISFLLWIWLAFFIINVGQVARSQMEIWPILDESGDARIRMFFSPSCKYCIEGINILSGNVNVAFYPVAENDEDVYRLAKMQELLGTGMNLAEALGQSRNATPEGFFFGLRPDMLLLRFRLLRNKAYIFSSGSQGVPFFENRGLPKDILTKIEERKHRASVISKPIIKKEDKTPADDVLPVETGDGGQCGNNLPCPPENR